MGAILHSHFCKVSSFHYIFTYFLLHKGENGIRGVISDSVCWIMWQRGPVDRSGFSLSLQLCCVAVNSWFLEGWRHFDILGNAQNRTAVLPLSIQATLNFIRTHVRVFLNWASCLLPAGDLTGGENTKRNAIKVLENTQSLIARKITVCLSHNSKSNLSMQMCQIFIERWEMIHMSCQWTAWMEVHKLVSIRFIEKTDGLCKFSSVSK